MPMQTVSVQEAAKRLAELISLAKQGDDIVIAQDEQTKVKLVPIAGRTGKRVFGQHRGMALMREDFDEPLPDDFWLGGHP